MNTGIKILIAVAVGFLGYEYAKKSGLWAQWFGGNSFTTSTQLLAYCQANPSGSATYVDSTGKASSATCAQWMQANPQAAARASASSGASTPSGGTTPVSSTTAAPSSLTSTGMTQAQVLAALIAAAQANPILGSDLANVDQWNFFLRTIEPAAAISDLSMVGVVRGQNDTMSAEQYMQLRAQAGLSGLFPQVLSELEYPYKWVN